MLSSFAPLFTLKGFIKHSKGISIVEFAILAPVLLAMFIYFWDTLVPLNLQIRHASASNQLALNFQMTPLRVSLVTVGSGASAQTQIKLLQLSSDQVSGTNGYLSVFNNMFNDMIDVSGTFADSITHNIALRLVYLCIHDSSTGTVAEGCPAPPVDAKDGYPYHAIVADGKNFFTSPGPDDGDATTCFGATDSAKYQALYNRFDSYVSEQINFLTTDENVPPIGTLQLDVPTGLPEWGNLTSYLPIKPLLFWMMCSEAPRFLEQNEPVVDFGIFYPDNEVGYSGS